MNSTGKRVPPSPKPRMCADCKKVKAIKGKSLCATCEYQAEHRNAQAQVGHTGK